MKTLIKEHLNKLIEAKHKNISSTVYKQITPNLRENISQISNPLELSSEAWNIILSSTEVITYINNSPNLSVAAINALARAERSVQEFEKAIKFKDLDQIKILVETILKENRDYYQYRYNESNIFFDIIQYSILYAYDKTSVENITKQLINLRRNNTINHYENLGEERIEFLKFILLPYSHSKVIANQVEHFKNEKVNFDFYQFLYETLEVEEFTKLFIPIQKAILNSNNPDQLKHMMKKILLNKNGVHWLKQICPSTEDILLELEIRKLYNANEDEGNAFTLIYGVASPLTKIFSTINEISYYYHLRNYIKTCVMKSKKAFIRLVSENIEIFTEFHKSHFLFKEKFNSIINVNTLNKKNLIVLSQMHNDDNFNHLHDDTQLTFQEFEFLNKKTSFEINVFYNLMNMSIEQRMRTCRELPSLNSLLEQFEPNELMERLISLLQVKPMKDWFIDKNFIKFKATDSQKLHILLAPELFEKYESEIHSGIDIDFIVKNKEILQYATSLAEAKVLFISEDKDCQFLVNDLKLTKAFIQDNKSNIVSFCERGLAHVYHTIHTVKKMSLEQLENLRLITKAELAGRLEEIKFVEDDFELEIGLSISENTKEEWKKNRNKSGSSFYIEETFDYESTIRIGENPVESCLHWNNGMYSRCLLSHFDTNKKIIVAKDNNGNIKARASLRLTKGSNTKIKKETKSKILGFKDIEEGQIESEKQGEEVKEELILFLENCYTSLASKQNNLVSKSFINLAKEKAAELGAKLVISNDYKHIISPEEFKRQEYYMFISYSKNGYQYLDSLTGQASESNEGSYKQADILMQQFEIN